MSQDEKLDLSQFLSWFQKYFKTGIAVELNGDDNTVVIRDDSNVGDQHIVKVKTFTKFVAEINSDSVLSPNQIQITDFLCSLLEQLKRDNMTYHFKKQVLHGRYGIK